MITIRRSDLNFAASSTSSSPDPELVDLFRATFKHHFDLSHPVTSPTTQLSAPTVHKERSHSPPPTELSFRLFRKRPSTTTAAPKIRLDSPDTANAGDGSFVQPHRPWEHYFATPPSAAQWARLRSAAVTGEEVRSWCESISWPGCAVPWKVTTISTTSGKAVTRHEGLGRDTGMAIAEGGGKRRRAGKKSRIATRRRASAVREREDAKRRDEEMWKEKRARKNREKKFKRKERMKAQAAARIGGQDGDNTS